MALDLYNRNPSLIWQGQGTTIDNNGGMSVPGEEAPNDNFWDWWKDNGEGASSAANAILCAINPRRYGCYDRDSNNNSNKDTNAEADHTLLYVAIGIAALLLLLFLLNK